MNAIQTRNCRRAVIVRQVTETFSILFSVSIFALLPFKSGAQGTVNFNNFVSGSLRSPIYNVEPGNSWTALYGNTTAGIPAGTQVYTGALLSGSGWRAQLWATPGANQPQSALQPAYPITTFRTLSGAGLVAGVTATLTGVPVDCPVATVQLRVWPATFSNNWEKAEAYWAAGQTPAGFSQLFNVTNIGGGTFGTPNLSGLRSFCLAQLPADLPWEVHILEHPESKQVNVGATVSFTATVAGSGPKCWWRFNNSPLSAPILTSIVGGGGTTNLVLTLTNVQPEQAGIYSLVASNSYDSGGSRHETVLFSSNATLTIGSPGPLAVAGGYDHRAILSWSGGFVLQSATNIAGPFTDLPGPVVVSPFTNTDLAGPRFFRLRN